MLSVLHAAPSGEDVAVVREAIESLGHQAVHARDSAEAMAQFDALRPQLVIVDSEIDGAGGLALLRKIRSSGHSPWVPALVTLAAPAGPATLAAALEAGADDGLSKPLDAATLTLRLRGLQRFAAVHGSLQSIVDSVLEAIITIDASGRVLTYNRAAQAVFGHSADEVVGRNVSMLMPASFREHHDGSIAAHRQSGRARIIGVGRQVTGLRKSGETFPASLAVNMVKGALSGTYIGLLRDLSGERERERLAFLAMHDPLTGLPNRTRLMAALDEAVARDRAFALLFIDVDRFKRINDGLGHAVGDAVLTTIAGRLQHSVSRGDLVARISGDEFVALIDGLDDRRTAQGVADRLQDAIAASMTFGPQTLQVRVSIGIAMYGEDGQDPAGLLRTADAAMYRRKPVRAPR
jgi:diguanylate cyclase (GGDEF)-like protein/PAS domain S-box-containing protein